MFSEKTKTPKTFQFLPVDAAENLFKKMVISLRKKIWANFYNTHEKLKTDLVV